MASENIGYSAVFMRTMQTDSMCSAQTSTSLHTAIDTGCSEILSSRTRTAGEMNGTACMDEEQESGEIMMWQSYPQPLGYGPVSKKIK